MLLGIICTIIAAFGLYWLSKLLPDLYSAIVDSDYSFMKNSIVFHLLQTVFFLGLLITGGKLIISAINKRTTDLITGLPLYFAGAALIIIGLFYLIFQQTTYAIIAIITGVVCIGFEYTVEVTQRIANKLVYLSVCQHLQCYLSKNISYLATHLIGNFGCLDR